MKRSRSEVDDPNRWVRARTEEAWSRFAHPEVQDLEWRLDDDWAEQEQQSVEECLEEQEAWQQEEEVDEDVWPDPLEELTRWENELAALQEGLEEEEILEEPLLDTFEERNQEEETGNVEEDSAQPDRDTLWEQQDLSAGHDWTEEESWELFFCCISTIQYVTVICVGVAFEIVAVISVGSVQPSLAHVISLRTFQP